MDGPGAGLKRSLLIIPAFNEAHSLPGVIRETRRLYPELDILVVDDGSSDETRRLGLEAGAVVLSHIANMGYGVAVQTGYKYAIKRPGYSHVVQMDGDGQHSPRDVGRLIAPVVAGEADLVIGSRFGKDGGWRYAMPWQRRAGTLIFRFLLRLFTRQRIGDITSGFQAFNRDVLAAYVSDEFPDSFPDADVLLLQLRAGFVLVEIPSEMSPNPEGRSMHRGFVKQAFYAVSMILSIGIAVLRTWTQSRVRKRGRRS